VSAPTRESSRPSSSRRRRWRAHSFRRRGDGAVDGRERQAQSGYPRRVGAKRVDDRRQRLRRRVPVEHDRRQRRLLAAPQARQTEGQARRRDRGEPDQRATVGVAPDQQHADARVRQPLQSGNQEIRLADAGGEVAPDGLETQQVAAVDSFDQSRGAVRRVGHNGIAPALAATTKSASTRV
jgi:hypothetical protein